MSLLTIVVLQSCAPLSVPPPHPPFNDQEIENILDNIREQEDAVHNFYSLGRIMLQGPGPDFEANALIIGTRNPLNIKLEITHFWGRPLLQILLTETRLHILSFPEKQYYVADVREPLPVDLLPVYLDTNQLWSVGRGFPILSRHKFAISDSNDHISLLNGKGNIIQAIDFKTEKHLPRHVFLPEHGLILSFSDFTSDNNIQYAKKITMHDQACKTTIKLEIKQMVIKEAIDNSVFELVVPSDFEYIQGGKKRR